MKKLLRNGLLLCLALVMLFACVACQPSASNPTPTPEPTVEPTPAPTPEPTPEPAPAPANFFDKVFDTSEDEGKLTVRYLQMLTWDADCYAGDCAVYTAPTGEIMVVDCGNALSGAEIIPQLDAMGVTKIDIMVFSHPHADHVGALPALVDKYEIGQIYTNGYEYNTATYQNGIDAATAKGIPVGHLTAGDTFMFGELVTVEVFNPFPEDIVDVDLSSAMGVNNGSVAMLLTYGESTFWTAGDLYVQAEERLVDVYGDIHADVVKMNHHGKDTSNCVHYLDMLQPKIAVAMLSDVSPKAIGDRHVFRGAQIFYTYADGAIRISSPGDGTYDVQTQFLRDIPYLAEPAEDGHYVVE